MLKELFESVVSKAQEAMKPQVVEIHDLKKILVAEPGGESVLHDIKRHRPDGFKAKVLSLADLVATLAFISAQAVERRKEFAGDFEKLQSSIFVGEKQVVAFVDNAVRVDSVEMPLMYSPQFCEIRSLDRAFSQTDLIRFLRINLADTNAEGYVSIFRDLKFDRSASSGGKANHTGESMGRSIEQHVVAGQEIPEQLKLSVPIFSNLDIKVRFSMVVHVTINFGQETVQLTVAPSDVIQAIQFGGEHIRAKLGEAIGQSDSVMICTGSLEPTPAFT